MFLDMGYEPLLFWELSLAEIYDLLESYQRKQELEAEKMRQQLKVNAIFNATLARQVGEYVALLFSKEAQITPLHQLYPNLFEDESREDYHSMTTDQELAYYKAKMDDFAFWHNARLKKKGGGNCE
ncbi:hypothetical protein [Turicibacter sanguinis]|uniref:hypothetical protein n=1 Tax=Turicibacter sanguinis TaxID=154288 RepID=UPI0018AA030E|nr:hypothetical protein [Turicibacter sanguinis]MDB8553829.1 hypothetical protein [Turicibacter sanguinis]